MKSKKQMKFILMFSLSRSKLLSVKYVINIEIKEVFYSFSDILSLQNLVHIFHRQHISIWTYYISSA